jgi:arylsulfatase A-like enzyme
MYDYTKIILPTSITDTYTRKPRYQRDVLWPWHNVGHMTTEDWQKTTSYFYGFVTMIDDAVGMVLETLKNEGLEDNTLIIFASDQGSMLADHGLYDKGPYSYDDLMRIPLLVKVPKSSAGKITRQVSLIDINQTLVEWMNLEPKDINLDSRSLFPLMTNGNDGWNCADESYYRYEWYNGKWYGIRTIRTPQLKYCYNSVDVDEMYDLKKDPKEMNNVYDNPEYAGQQIELQNRLLEHLKTTEDPLYSQMKTFLKNKATEKPSKK